MPLPLLDVIGSAAKFAADIVDRFWPKKMDEAERTRATLEIQRMLEARDNTLVTASKEIMVAELQQADNFTKRARPSIIYIGLAAIIFNHVLVPFVNRIIEWIIILKGEGLAEMAHLSPINLPSEFWYVWGGVCSVYALGRTAEKRGARGALISWITGNKDVKP